MARTDTAERETPFPFYILDEDRNPVPASKAQWDAFNARGPVIVAETKLAAIEYCTSFVGVDFSLGADEVPALFETCIAAADEGEELSHSFAWQDAEAEHHAIVAAYEAPLATDGEGDV